VPSSSIVLDEGSHVTPGVGRKLRAPRLARQPGCGAQAAWRREGCARMLERRAAINPAMSIVSHLSTCCSSLIALPRLSQTYEKGRLRSSRHADAFIGRATRCWPQSDREGARIAMCARCRWLPIVPRGPLSDTARVLVRFRSMDAARAHYDRAWPFIRALRPAQTAADRLGPYAAVRPGLHDFSGSAPRSTRRYRSPNSGLATACPKRAIGQGFGGASPDRSNGVRTYSPSIHSLFWRPDKRSGRT